MAKLPQVDALPTPRPGGADQYNLSIRNPLGSLAKGVGAIGEAMIEAQDEEDTLRAEDAFNQLQKKRLDLTMGDDGFTNVKSRDVVERQLYKEYDEKFTSAADEISKSLSNEEQRKKFQRRADVSRLQYNTDLAKHVHRENESYAEQVFKGGKVVELENAASSWDQPGVIKFSIERTKRLIEQQAERKGWPADVKKAELLKAESDIHESVISQAISMDNPEYAKEYFDKHKKHIEGTEQPKLEELIRKGGIRVTAQEFTDNALLEGWDEKKALAEARKKFKGDEEAAVVAQVRDRFNEIDRLKDEREAKASDEAWGIYAETRNFDDIPLTVLQEMDGKEQEQLRAYAQKVKKGEPVQTNYQVYEELLDMAKNNPREFKELQLYKFQPILEEKHLDSLIKMKTDRAKINYVDTQNTMRKRYLPQFGLDAKEIGKDNDDGKAINMLYNNIDSQVEAFQYVHGREPDDKEFKSILDQMLLDKAYTEVGFPDPEKPVAAMTPEELEEAYIETEGQQVFLNDIPEQTRIEIIQRLTRRGIPVTEKEIARSWLILTGKL